MSNLYKHEEIYRGEKLINLFGKQHLTVCGAGAIGSNLVDNLARHGFQSFRVIDFDRVEWHNINNQLYSNQHIGSLKVHALADIVYEVNGSEVEMITKKLEADNIKKYFKDTTLVVDAFDNIPSRKLVNDYCLKNSIPCLHAGVLTDMGEVVWNDRYQLPETTDEPDACDYPLARNIVMGVVTLASEILIEYFSVGKQRSAVMTLKNFTARYL